MKRVSFYTSFISVSIAIFLSQIAFASPSKQKDMAIDCQQSDTAQNGYAVHKRIMVSTHPAFRPLCLPIYKDTLIIEGEDTDAYLSLVGYHQNKIYFERDTVSASNAQPNREYDNYRKRSDGRKRRYINVTIPNNDVFSRMVVYVLPWALFNDEYYLHYFCGNNCKPGKKRLPSRWGGNGANQFEQKRTFQTFMNEAFPAIENASLPVDSAYAYIISNGNSSYNFATGKLEISLSFYAGGVYKPKDKTQLLKHTAIYENPALYDKNNTSSETGIIKILDRATSIYAIEVDEVLAEKIYINKGIRCLAKIKTLDWIFADSIDSTLRGKTFMPIWESASDQIDCYSNNQFNELYFSFNWRTGKRI
ncbi:hypothetical protein Q4567_13140 [Aliiglaciecola sp. 2_MG-2023]|uniref:hypothetical protein n=1 Tax=unclassified Aliiglaciecola TaxID=2593648 RepID=UPI0026E21492|nr:MULTISPECIES: hypothetical protein [unclassified Aliiglaciecola]MDO6711672.1 hypothetical protein [Aliiglaciecola sp. 2_MG-2023]MDO6752743.1 hypothetical protein [Aliiglaciecola sp. 1_MG-2023]